MAETTKPWIDLSAHKARLAAFLFPDGTANMIISGVTNADPEWGPLQAIGFMPSRSGRTLFRPGLKVTMGEIKTIFPKAFSRAMPVSEILLKVSGDPVARDAARDARNVRPLGMNHLGQEVFEGENGRFVRAAQGEVVSESAVSSPAMFLRATTPADTALCADGFVEEMARGRVMRPNDLRRFAGVIHGSDRVMEEHDPRLRQAQEAVEAAVQRYLAKNSDIASRDTFDLAVKLTEHQPQFVFRTSASVINQQYSTPLPMSVAAQRILGDTSGLSVLEPTIGNGSLVMCLPEDTKVVGVEIDSNRADRVKLLRSGMEIKNADFMSLGSATLFSTLGGLPFDCTIANPPFGGLQKKVKHHELTVNRIDQLIALRSLELRKEDGRSVFIIGADRENIYDAQAGVIMGGSKTFFAWLADHYEILDAVEIDGSLYSKQGSTYPVRMVTVGRRRSAEESAEAYKARGATGKKPSPYDLPDRLPVIRDWTSLYDHAEQVSERIGAKLPEPFAVKESDLSGESKDDARSSNEFQVPYTSMSKIGEASAMVPANMVAPLSVAFERFIERYEKDVDDFVAERLEMTIDEMSLAFSPEQIDAIALNIKNIDEGRGFVVGDQTGQGKGRILAGVCRYCALENIPVTFITEKANLFSDFWRDLRDIGTDSLFRPAVINADARINDVDTNKTLFGPIKSGELQGWLKSGLSLSDTGYNLMMTTYSQFNRDANSSPKAAWLPTAVKGGLLVLDESHNATGESNTAINIALAVDSSLCCSYSSATYAKKAKSMAAYSKLFPASVTSASLVDILEMGGEPLQEILSAMLVEDGVMIRREHDLSRLSFETSTDVARLQRNEELSDRLSEILLAMAGVSGDVDRMTSKLQKEIKVMLEGMSAEQRSGNRMGVSHTNFGSRLYNVMRQFMLATKVDHVGDLAIKIIQQGMKPVIVLEGTNESVLKETLLEDFSALDEVDGDNKSIAASFADPDSLPPMTFRNILSRMLERIQMVQRRDAYGEVTVVHGVELAENEEEADSFTSAVNYISRMIDEFPDLPLSPIDALTQKIEREGFSTGEVSGRGLSIRENVDGSMSIVERVDDRLGAIHGFNNGQHDAIVLSRAGSTGLSLHASERFADQRQRVMVELQIANNVAERVQFFGRVNRRGQVNDPKIVSISSGLPAEMRTLAMQNAKLRSLSANTQSNRENAAEMDDVPDVLNWVGDKVCKRLLEENPEIASMLDIDIDSEDGAGDLYFVNRLTGRMCLLKVAEQKRLWGEIQEMYEATIVELEAQGKNPFKQTVYDWNAEIVSKTKLSGSEQEGGSVFDRAVYVADLRWQEQVDPLKWDVVERMIAGGKERLLNDNRIDPYTPRYAWEKERFCSLESFREISNSRFDAIMKAALPKKFETVALALADKEANAVKQAQGRKAFLQQNLDALLPGSAIKISDREGDALTGLVVSLDLPRKGEEQYLSKYQINVAMPGEPSLRRLTLSQLSGDPKFESVRYGFIPKQLDFDTAPAGLLEKTRSVLVGNLFSAAQVAAENQMGHAGIFTDKDGVRHHAIILPRGYSMDDVLEAPQRMSAKAAALVLRENVGETFYSTASPSSYGAANAFSLTVRGGEVVLIAPGSKTRGGCAFANPSVIALTGDFSGSRDAMRATFPAKKLGDVLRELEVVNVFFYATASQKDAVLERLAEAPAAAPRRREEDVAA